jgi:hypothetical protein
VQVLNGTDTLPVSANGAFTVSTGLITAGTYAVTVGTPTTTPAQTCTVQNGSGTITTANVTNVVIYCTYTVTAATLNGMYTTAFAYFDHSGPAILDGVAIASYNGTSAYTGNETLNSGGAVYPQSVTDTYAVATSNGIASLTTGSGNGGGIEGANADSVVGVEVLSGLAPAISVGVLPSASATTASISGNYTLVSLTATVATGTISGYDATITLANGAITGTYVENNGGTITGGNTASGSWSVASGVVTAAQYGSGAVSADGDLVVLADTTSGDDPSINVAVRRGTGVTKATFEGVYSVSEYGGTMVSATFGQAITLFAYGNGTYSVTFTKNANGTVTLNNTDAGTYTVAADGTLALTDSEGNVYSGAIAADGNALVLASVTGVETPAIFAGVRQ